MEEVSRKIPRKKVIELNQFLLDLSRSNMKVTQKILIEKAIEFSLLNRSEFITLLKDSAKYI
jgi:hypothetical protein